MKVQPVWFPDTNRSSWLVLGDDYLPIRPVLVFLKFQEDLGRSPYTIRTSAHHLKLYWEFLRDERVDWKEVDVARLASFISWLRTPQPGVVSPLGDRKARRTDATINQILGVVHVFYDFHARMKNVPELPLYRFLEMPNRHYKPFLHGIARAKPERSRVVSIKPEEGTIKLLTDDQVQKLLDACTHTRDKFLLALLFETGMRIGHYIGWFKHVNPFTPTFSRARGAGDAALDGVGERYAPRATGGSALMSVTVPGRSRSASLPTPSRVGPGGIACSAPLA